MEDKNKNNKEKAEDIPLLEWIIAAAGLMVVLFSLGYLIYTAITQDGKPPDVIVQVESIKQAESGYIIKFKAKNNGDNTASDVIITGELMKGPKAIESSSVTIDYVPAHSEATGGLFFTKDPAKHRLEMRAEGYTKP